MDTWSEGLGLAIVGLSLRKWSQVPPQPLLPALPMLGPPLSRDMGRPATAM